ncbi:hypothetical protein FISHEDRAFT_49959 [Fistulina hepatica ATCC 64428]|uniref:RRM domain-containing protein n=1 Tax=Fistulina hepatica ATCC 64428 TaxID=1128425 RepID=A0A0D7A2A5_9AGAR|nr:hypothetical protein FISHEDRAFT_49959 [Fistulina hepatica ATCC 64428]
MSRPASTARSPLPRPQNHVNTQTSVLDTHHGRILCIADIRGRLSAINDLAREVNASAVIHTGDFGFFEADSLQRINDRTLRHLATYSPLIPSAQRTHLLAPENLPAAIRNTFTISLLSEFPLLLSGQIKLQVPVYTVWGACEDVIVLEKFRAGTYSIENLHVLDEATTRLLDIGGVKLRLLGLGGALVPHKLFDNGDGNATIAGGQGTMWTTVLQIGELVDTAQRVYDNSETRLLVTHASPGREGIIAQLALVLKADLTLSAGLHFRYTTSYNDFSIQPDFEGFRHKLATGKECYDRIWETVRDQVNVVLDDNQKVLLEKAMTVMEKVPPAPHTGVPVTEEPAWKNCWNWNLCDAAYGSLILDIREGRVSAELKSQGFNYAYRRTATHSGQTPSRQSSALPNVSAPPSAVGISQPPTKATTPAPPKSTTPNLTSPKAPTSAPKVTSSSPPPKSPVNGTEKLSKRKLKQERERERKAKEEAATATTEAGGEEGTANENKEAAPGDAKSADEKTPSPADSTSGGARTPRIGRPARNPWTIFFRSTHSAAEEDDIREFFGDAKSGITKVSYPSTMPGRNRRIAYIEFGDEEAMRAALEKHNEALRDGTKPTVEQATEKEQRGEGFRGRGRGRGGFASRGLAAAGLTAASRGRGSKRNSFSDAKNSNGAPPPAE